VAVLNSLSRIAGGCADAIFFFIAPMFKFDFDIDDAEDIDEALNLEDHPKDAKAAQPPGHNVTPLEPHREVPIHQLVRAQSLPYL